MKKKEPIIKTKRMRLTPMTDREIEALMEAAGSDALRAAYGEMLAGCRNHPEDRIWYAPWRMTLKDESAYMGDLGFQGPAKEHAVEIGCRVPSEYEEYTAEAVQALTQWAFGNSEVVFVEAEADNGAPQGVLEKCGFAPDGSGFVLERPLTSWMAIYMLFGLSIGTTLGTSAQNTGIGMIMGLCLGLCIGVALDSSEKKTREKLRKNREA